VEGALGIMLGAPFLHMERSNMPWHLVPELSHANNLSNAIHEAKKANQAFLCQFAAL
jgi:hypothetical protein